MELTNNRGISPKELAIERKEQLDSIRRVIIDLPDPLEDPNWQNHNGEWRTYHGWMLEIRVSVLELLRDWPDYASILKLSLANAVYHKAVFGQISKAHFENQFKANICAKTHPMLLLVDSPTTDEDRALGLDLIYAGRQAMLIAFIQLFEWLTQDEQKLVPAAPYFARFNGMIRLPEYWIAAVGPIKAQKFGMVLHPDGLGTDYALPVHQFRSNILPVPNITAIPDLSNKEQPKAAKPITSFPNKKAIHFTPKFKHAQFIDNPWGLLDDIAEKAGVIGSKANGYGLLPSVTPAKLCGFTQALLKNGFLLGEAKHVLRALASLYDVSIGKKAEYPDKLPGGRGPNLILGQGRRQTELALINEGMLKRPDAHYLTRLDTKHE